MKLTTSLLLTLASAITLTNAANSWAGSNFYFLQGLSPSDQTAYLDALASSGAKSVRLWVKSLGTGCQKGIQTQNNLPELEPNDFGTFDDSPLDALDTILVQMQQRGLKAIISPHDANLLNGSNGDDIYGKRYGAVNFYSNTTAQSQYDTRIAHILNYKGKTSQQVWGSYSEAIMAFDIQNEPMGVDITVCTQDATNGNIASNWLTTRAVNMRKVLNSLTTNGNQQPNPIKISTGGIGGDVSHGCTTLAGAMQSPAIDLVAVHGYKGPQSDNPTQWSSLVDGLITGANGKLVYIEEFGTPQVTSQPSAQKTDFAAQTDDIDKGGLPWMYWQILPAQECPLDPNDKDVNAVYLNSTVDIIGAVGKAAKTVARQDWSAIVTGGN